MCLNILWGWHFKALIRNLVKYHCIDQGNGLLQDRVLQVFVVQFYEGTTETLDQGVKYVQS